MPARELAGAVAQRCGVGDDGHAVEKAAHVVGELFDGSVALRGILVQRLGDDVIEVVRESRGVIGQPRPRQGAADRPRQQIRRSSSSGPVGRVRARAAGGRRGARTARRRARTRRMRRLTASPRACSGLAYSGVSGTSPVRVSASRAPAGSSSFAIPKSSSFGAPSAPTRMLLGPRSRCTTRWPWALLDRRCTPRDNSGSRSRTGGARSARCAASELPSTSSITRYGCPASVVPPSRSLHDARVTGVAEDPRLVAEAGERLGRREAAAQQLDRDALFELRIRALAAIHGAHAALADQRHRAGRRRPACRRARSPSSTRRAAPRPPPRRAARSPPPRCASSRSTSACGSSRARRSRGSRHAGERQIQTTRSNSASTLPPTAPDRPSRSGVIDRTACRCRARHRAVRARGGRRGGRAHRGRHAARTARRRRAAGRSPGHRRHRGS